MNGPAFHPFVAASVGAILLAMLAYVLVARLKAGRFVVLCLLGFLTAVPFLWMISASFKPYREVEEVHIVPREPTAQNYPVVLDLAPVEKAKAVPAPPSEPAEPAASGPASEPASAPATAQTQASAATTQTAATGPASEPASAPATAQTQAAAVAAEREQDKYLGLKFGRWYFNNVFLAVAITVLQVLTSAMAAYAFSRIRWRGRDMVFLLYLATMMIPGVVTMIPNYQIMISLRFLNTYHGLILPAAFSAFGTFLLRQFMLSIPSSLDEAATIDGAGHWKIFWEVILPLARPGLIALAILTFLGAYKSFFWPLIMLNNDEYYPLSIGMLYLDNTYGRQTELIMAATVMNVVPLIIVFVVFQKLMVKGLQLGSVKG